MADPIKSSLLVDFESLQRSLVGTVADTRLAERTPAWLEALEAGRLGPKVKRTLLVKRAYVGPSVHAKSREQLAAAGFDLVDPTEGSTRTSADMNMALDTMEALARPEGVQEFIFISAAGELTGLLARLKGLKRVSVIYADAATPPSDRELADAVIEATDFARIVGTDTASTPDAKPAPSSASSTPAGPKADIESFARRVHAATSIPLFSPKTFAELFRHLVDEIAANGYHFQSTARNVADRMVTNGRNVTRRQVVFIVKGLALKGHVFSTTDTPEKLAEVFREQARYLITSAGISLTPHEDELLTAWFQSRPPAAKGGATAPASSPATPSVPEPPDSTKATIAETIEREVAKAVTASRPAQPPTEKIKPPRQQPPPPAPAQKPQPVRAVDLPKSAAAKPQPLASAREEAKAVIAARIAGAARMKPAGTRTPIPAKPAPKAPTPPAPSPEPEAKPAPAPAPAAQPPAQSAEGGNADALENSILAAIAEAVDVLVEDSATEQEPEEEPAPPPPPPPARDSQNRRPGKASAAPPQRQPEPPPPPPPAEPEESDEESNDIGDQIQRIIASYNRNRGDE
jgi:hypothetical protein